jgi:hypothetical protein
MRGEAAHQWGTVLWATGDGDGAGIGYADSSVSSLKDISTSVGFSLR